MEAFEMKKTVLALAIAAAFAPAVAMAEAGDIVVRLRATHISPDENSNLGGRTSAVYNTPGLGGVVYGSEGAGLRVDSNTIPEIDLSYYITKNIAAELILAVGTRHEVSVSGSGGILNRRSLGEVNLLPPTLTLQWHFMPDQMFDPYVGAGVSYVRAMDNSLTARTALGNLPIRIDQNSWGPAIQAGFDVNLQDRWLVNLDVKKIWFETHVHLSCLGAASLTRGYRKVDELDVDPWVISVGLGKKF